MLELFRNPSYNFIGRRRWAYTVSVLFIGIGLASIAMKGGLRYGIDFSGGTLIQVRFEKPPAVDRIRSTLDQIKLGESVIQEFGDPREFLFRLPLADAPPEEVTRRVKEVLEKESALGGFYIRPVEFVWPQVGQGLQLQALYALLAGVAGNPIYNLL